MTNFILPSSSCPFTIWYLGDCTFRSEPAVRISTQAKQRLAVTIFLQPASHMAFGLVPSESTTAHLTPSSGCGRYPRGYGLTDVTHDADA